MNRLVCTLTLLISAQALALPAGTKGEDGNFKLSEKAIAHLGIKFKRLAGKGPWQAPRGALVRIKLTQGVYRRYDGEITFIITKNVQLQGQQLLFDSDDLESGDEIAVAGANYLRMTETDLNSETVDNCAH
jgi:hypothetical protein